MSFEPQYKRGDYIPIVTVTDSNTIKTNLLDYYYTKYLSMVSQVTSYTQYQIEEKFEGRLDLISYNFYETPDLWWFIGIFNGIVNPVLETTVGSTIRIPDRNQIDNLLQASTNPSNQTNSIEML